MVGLNIVIFGASGDLARRKVIPALFSLYSQNLLPSPVRIVGFGRTDMTSPAFREKIAEHLTCRYVAGQECKDKQTEFLHLCYYVRGDYEDRTSYEKLHFELRRLEGSQPWNRLYYFSVPPTVYIPIARGLAESGMVYCTPGEPWARAIVEKPFGWDRPSSDEINRALASVFSEPCVFRIDHYLGKEIVQNLFVLRFANVLFEPLWSHDFIQQIQITWKETQGIGNRAGYFDRFGIIRDVVQNHLTQVLALLAMDKPSHFTRAEIARRKLDVLRSIPPVTRDNVILGQYGPGKTHVAYKDEPGVSPNSRTPTYAALELRLQMDRWQGVPFLIRAGKGLDRQANEIHICFKKPPEPLFDPEAVSLPSNRLVIRIQPDEGIFLHILTKVPGLNYKLDQKELDLRYATAFKTVIPEAYETLLLEVIEGNNSLFPTDEEIAAAWDIFTPLLDSFDQDSGDVPLLYRFGSEGPAEAELLPKRYGLPWF